MSVPYVSYTEFKSSPTAIDTSTLDQSARGDTAAQSAALNAILRRASAWIDSLCEQSLFAAQRTETKEIYLTRDSRLTIHPDSSPIIAVTAVNYRLSPSLAYTTIDSSNVQIYGNWFTIYGLTNFNLTSNLVIQQPALFYNSPYSRQVLSDVPITANYTYVSGYLNTVLNGAVTVNSTALTLADATGAYIGLKFTLYDGKFTENCEVLSVVGSVITLKNPLIFAHIDTTPVSAVPDDVKEATILLASFLIRERGSVALTMNETTVNGVNSTFTKSDDVDIAKSMLRPYKRLIRS